MQVLCGQALNSVSVLFPLLELQVIRFSGHWSDTGQSKLWHGAQENTTDQVKFNILTEENKTNYL